tara:strand:- start:1005 stop:1199 length:195 start_codon:yes stop_codon:yes gene_type:complete
MKNFKFQKNWNNNVEEYEGRNGRNYIKNGKYMWAIFQNEELIDNLNNFSEVKRKYPTAKRIKGV